ncbi:ribbon-helix-helix protein, CopG family [Gulosibacter molinativorax]|uniref:Ribbon-helix-helix protein, CopG family n=1 Tax=Gulosibacter molinativorax TaxID=256821 RepID=A0ABT7C9X3_9MICO|nr:ribbon-helix-helix protein, CopG family [Gulosibacter molinativorax]MDJ1371957.1 ribbon-helix-helix protein, CopG family [Gulosibacter molinativorax]QUY62679.1 Putative regulatory protein [Gulosibacter molinativorax]
MERKIQGKEISESQVDEWVAAAEAGYEVEELRKRAVGRPARSKEASQVVPVRLTKEELDAVMERAHRENLNRSEAIREALRAWSSAA